MFSSRRVSAVCAASNRLGASALFRLNSRRSRGTSRRETLAGSKWLGNGMTLWAQISEATE
jgi:hypothetical protein